MKDREKDVLIVGGGPSGISAALWCAELGLTVALLERGQKVGGQLHWVHNKIDNYLGARFANGSEIASAFDRSIAEREIEILFGANVAKIRAADKNVIFQDGTVIIGRALIVATGLRRRKLNLPGEDLYLGRGVLESGSRDPRAVEGKRVAVIGGGDAALENALILAKYAAKIFLIHRSDRYSARSEFIEAVSSNSMIERVMDTAVEIISGDGEGVKGLLLNTKGIRRELPIDSLIVRIGYEPNSEILRGIVEIDQGGYISVDREGRTSSTGIFAVGDVANPLSPTIATAVGSGASAAKTVARWLQAIE